MNDGNDSGFGAVERRGHSARLGEVRDLLASAVPPQDLDAERALVGAALVGGLPAVSRVVSMVQASDFYGAAHGKAWSAIIHCWAAGTLDVVSVAAELRRRGQLGSQPGEVSAPWLAEAEADAFSAANIASHARLVADHARRRLGIGAATEVLRELFEARRPAEELLGAVMAKIQAALAAAAPPSVSLVQAAGNVVAAVQDRRANPQAPQPTVFWGVERLDEAFGGLGRKQLTILAGRPSHGKSSLAMQTAIMAARAAKSTLFFTLEMDPDEQAARALNMLSGIAAQELLTGDPGAAADHAVGEAAMRLPGKLWFSEARKLSAIRGECLRRKASPDGLSLVVVDYLQLVEPESSRAPRHEQVAGISRALKVLSSDLDVAILACCQLNREQDQRAKVAATAKQPKSKDQRLYAMMPKLSDVRESGQIEQDAHRVLFTLRPCLLDREAFHETEAVLVMAKNRNGPTGCVHTTFDPKRFAFGGGFLAESEAGGEWAPPHDGSF